MTFTWATLRIRGTYRRAVWLGRHLRVCATGKKHDTRVHYGTGNYSGPFDNTYFAAGFDAVYPPETGVDMDASYIGARGVTIRWKVYEPGKTG